MKYQIASIIILFMLLLAGCTADQCKKRAIPLAFADTTDATNDFYDNEETHLLPLKSIIVNGETTDTFRIDLDDFPLHSVIVKETRWKKDSNEFIGAYRYDGPSLYDILNPIPLQKKNAGEFGPIIDAYVEITNGMGEKVLFSWGEIFYPVHRHEIIIATRVTQIVPSKTKDKWPVPDQARIISASDLLTERNISGPQRITIRSLERSFEVNRDPDPLYSDKIIIYDRGLKIATISESLNGPQVTYPNVFYGRGLGIHGVTPFSGYYLRDILSAYFPADPESIMTGIFTVSAADGYRAAYTYSEIMNRNDQSEVLLIDKGKDYGGRFNIYPSADFFSDRSVKAVNGLWYDE